MELAYFLRTSQHCYLTLKETMPKNKTGFSDQLQAGKFKKPSTGVSQSCSVVEAASSKPAFSLDLRVPAARDRL